MTASAISLPPPTEHPLPRGDGPGVSPLRRRELAAFGAPAIPMAALHIPMLVYVPTLYVRDIGLPLATVGALFLFVRLVDIALDPLLGTLMDRFGSRWGRFRPAIVGGALVLAPAAGLLFSPPAHASATYLFCALSLTCIGYSICYLAHLSWGAVISSDYHVRSNVFGWWQAGYLLGSMLVLALPLLIERGFGLSVRAGVSSMGWFVVLSLPVTIWIAIGYVGEPTGKIRAYDVRISHYFRLMVRPNVRRLLAADLAIGTAFGMNGALFFFYITDIKGFSDLQTMTLLFINLTGSLSGAPLWTWMTNRIGKHRAAACAFFFYSVSLIAIAAMPADIHIAWIVLFLAGITLSAGPPLIRAMMADTGDEELSRTGVDNTALLASLFAGTNKLGLALAPGITFAALDWFGFHPKGPNASLGLAGLTTFYVGAPALLGLVSAILVWRHPITAEKHASIITALANTSHRNPSA